ncbi:MAG TPA: inositol monophosphatase family protein [Geobacteraceae bacterium]|nr:inositol monophosphatase family protein [Geobacteraceae bacterium]
MGADVDGFLARGIELAKEAGALQRDKLWQPVGIEFKGEIDLVTEVDRACEDLLVNGLKGSFPDHDFLAEENTYASHNSRYKWIIDPLDGTTNFAHGFPWFAVSIALEIDGEIALGIVYHTMMDEMFTALRGGGAFINGRQLGVSTRSPLRGSLLASGFPYDSATDRENNFAHFVNFQMGARGIRRAGSASLDLAYVAAGRLDGYWEAKLKPWDVAAGQLLVREAGGMVTGFDGGEYSVYSHRILASNGLIHGEMVEMLARPAPLNAL